MVMVAVLVRTQPTSKFRSPGIRRELFRWKQGRAYGNSRKRKSHFSRIYLPPHSITRYKIFFRSSLRAFPSNARFVDNSPGLSSSVTLRYVTTHIRTSASARCYYFCLPKSPSKLKSTLLPPGILDISNYTRQSLSAEMRVVPLP